MHVQAIGRFAARTARVGLRTALVVGVALGALISVGASPVGAPSAAAQEPAAIVTVATPDGALRALADGAWKTLAPNIGKGATVTDLAWHPTRPEILLVRRTIPNPRLMEPSYALVYVDLSTGREQTIVEGIGPQAEIVEPQIAPDGRSGLARIDCCLSRELITFALPLTGQPPVRRHAGEFLPVAARDVSLASVGPFTPDGRILVTADCCMGDEPPTNPRGLYRVSPDLTAGERLATDIDGLPLGLGPRGAWAAVLEPPVYTDEQPSGWRLTIIDLPSGRKRTPLGEGEMRLAMAGTVAPDGTILVATESPSDDIFKAYGGVLRITVDGAISPVLAPDESEVTAFAWASPAVVAAASRTAENQPQPLTPAVAAGEVRREVKVFFSKRPESDADFSAVFPVSRMADDAGVARNALRALLQGPTDDERAQGYFSEVGSMLVGPSTCGGERFTLRIADGTAMLKLCQQVRSAGIGQNARARSAIEATLRQFPTVQRVTLLSAEGGCLFDESGQNRCLWP